MCGSLVGLNGSGVGFGLVCGWIVCGWMGVVCGSCCKVWLVSKGRRMGFNGPPDAEQ